MVLLTKKLKTLLLLIFISTQIFAQTNDEIVKAFATSYDAEKKGDFKKGVEAVKKVYSESSYEINLRLGWLEYNAGMLDESVTHYQKALTLKPYSEEAKFGLIYPKAAQGKWTEVISLYEKILAVSPNNTYANYRLGAIYYGQKNYIKALDYFKKVVDLYPFGYDALLMYAWTNLNLGKNREAEVLFNKVLMLSPADESALEGLKLIK